MDLLKITTVSVISYLCLFLPTSIARSQNIKVGMSAPFTGTSREAGIELYRGAMAYIEHINRNGGIKGKQVVIQAYDDGYNPIPTIKNTIQLIEKDNAFLLFNYFGTPNVTRILPMLNRYKDSHIYLFFPYTGAQPPRQEPYKNLVFNLKASYRQETEGLVENLVKIGRKRIAVFYQVDAYGRSGWNGVRRSLAKQNLKIVAEATYPRGTGFSESFQPHVKILREANPDAIILVGLYGPCAGFIRDARNANWDIPIAGISVGSESILNLLVETGKKTGKDYTTNLINSQIVPSYDDTSLLAVREYREYMNRYQPKPPRELIGDEKYPSLRYSFDSFEGFLNAKLLVEVLKRIENSPEKAGKNDTVATQDIVELRKKIPQVTESIQNLDLGIKTPFSFGRNRNQALEQIYYTKIENGRFVPLTNWKQWAK